MSARGAAERRALLSAYRGEISRLLAQSRHRRTPLVVHILALLEPAAVCIAAELHHQYGRIAPEEALRIASAQEPPADPVLIGITSAAGLGDIVAEVAAHRMDADLMELAWRLRAATRAYVLALIIAHGGAELVSLEEAARAIGQA